MQRTESMGYLVNHLARLLANALRARIAHRGVVPGQFAQLLALYEHDGLTQSQLCERVSIDQSTMAHTLKRMERDGLIRRIPDQLDGRRAIIWLTERARELEDDLTGCAQQVNALATKGFTDDQISQCHQLVTRMIDNLASDFAG
ncbi:MAG: MarR family winged helix-turn-helix transcriptional regulator [Pseudonocardiaceae bacterium]